jgi:hypothetical protein
LPPPPMPNSPRVWPMPPIAPASPTGFTDRQGLTLVHFSAQLEPCLTRKSTLHTLNTPYHLLNTG